MNQDIIEYYRQRAEEYESVYWNPAEQDDLRQVTKLVQTIFDQKSVLELACGTGYWTERIAQAATTIHATDVNEAMLGIARLRGCQGQVTYGIGDVFDLPIVSQYQGLFAGFIWSHLQLQKLDQFLFNVQRATEPGGTVVVIDSNPIAETNHDPRNISLTDPFGNTFQNRTLKNGTTHLVLKNFPSEQFIREKLEQIGTEVCFYPLEHYWMASCKMKVN